MIRNQLYYENRIHKLEQKPQENKALIAKAIRKLRALQEASK